MALFTWFGLKNTKCRFGTTPRKVCCHHSIRGRVEHALILQPKASTGYGLASPSLAAMAGSAALAAISLSDPSAGDAAPAKLERKVYFLQSFLLVRATLRAHHLVVVIAVFAVAFVQTSKMKKRTKSRGDAGDDDTAERGLKRKHKGGDEPSRVKRNRISGSYTGKTDDESEVSKRRPRAVCADILLIAP